MIVVGASAISELLVDRGKGGSVEARIQGHRLYAPEFLNLEVMSVLRGLYLGKKITTAQTEAALSGFRSMRIELREHGPLLPRVWELRDNYSAYDASYVATAETLGTRFLTADARIARGTGARCPVELVS